MNHPPDTRNPLAVPMLLLICAIWAGAFVALEAGPRGLNAAYGPGAGFAPAALFLFLRFTLATLLMPLLMPGALRAMDRRNIVAGAVLGLFFSAHLLTQLLGLGSESMDPSTSAFLTALFVVFAPLFGFAFRGRRPRLGVVLGIVPAVAGVAFIQGPPKGNLSAEAWLTLAAAALYGGQIVVTDVVTRSGKPPAQTFAMIATCALVCGAAFAVSPGALGMLAEPAVHAALADWRLWAAEGYLALVSTVVALALLNRWQKEVSANQAAIIFTTTPVFVTLLALAFGQAELSGWLAFGAGMILCANLLAQLVGRAPARESKP
ncbi:MAG: DMT family transporter [Planctomycetes bacterium]|nr:DMT family transporter [Planctomycetota bacterium]